MKNISNKSEKAFFDLMSERGITLIPQPKTFKLDGTTYRPDFYSPQQNCYYEVSGTRQAYNASKKKYADFRKKYPDIRLIIVKPNGLNYRESATIQTAKSSKRCQYLICFHLPGETKKNIEKIAGAKQWSRALVIREALNDYIRRELREGKNE